MRCRRCGRELNDSRLLFCANCLSLMEEEELRPRMSELSQYPEDSIYLGEVKPVLASLKSKIFALLWNPQDEHTNLRWREALLLLGFSFLCLSAVAIQTLYIASNGAANTFSYFNYTLWDFLILPLKCLLLLIFICLAYWFVAILNDKKLSLRDSICESARIYLPFSVMMLISFGCNFFATSAGLFFEYIARMLLIVQMVDCSKGLNFYLRLIIVVLFTAILAILTISLSEVLGGDLLGIL